MATFYNQATLSYKGITTTSNTVSGELVEVLSATKTAVVETYRQGGQLTYLVSILNSGCTAYTGLTITDDLGAYTVGSTGYTPLTYSTGSVRYYVNGVLQPAPAVTAGPPLTISGITIPAGGNAMLVYVATANQYAPLAVGCSVTNTATVSGVGIEPLAASETVTPTAAPNLGISKSISPATVTENGQLTYTFLISNYGNTAAVETDDIIVTDTFDPVLDPITVTLNGETLTLGTNYTYNSATGAFATTAGTIAVPAAVYAQDPMTGSWTVTPGMTTMVITGTV